MENWTNTCPECGRNHARDVRNNERLQERISHLRRALYLVCGGDPARINEAMSKTEPTEPAGG